MLAMRDIRSAVRKSVDFLRCLNLFSSAPPTNDQHELNNQLISTRLFIFLLTFSLTILIIYTSALTITKTIIHKDPSLQQYQLLYQSQSKSLICPCTEVTTQQNIVLHGQYTLHQVCSSAFVTDQWINYLNQIRLTYDLLHLDDYRETSLRTFSALRSLCSLVDETITNALTRFYATNHVTIDLTPPDIFRIQLEALIDEFWSRTINEFSSSLQIVQNITQAKALLSSLQTDARLYVSPNDTSVFVSAKVYDRCYCSINAWCIERSTVFREHPSRDVLYEVPGMYRGCYTYESLLQSTLQCFYDQSCLSNLTLTMSQTIRSNASVLNATVKSRYLTMTTVGEMLQELMVDDWQWVKMYDAYYDACRPSECRYEVKTRNDFIYILTTIVGLIGGLNTALRFIVPHAVRYIRSLQVRKRIAVSQITVIESRFG